MSNLDERWYVYHNKLRPGFNGLITEIQTVSGKTVINWGGFDDSHIPNRIGIARHVVKLHNADLRRHLQAQRKET